MNDLTPHQHFIETISPRLSFCAVSIGSVAARRMKRGATGQVHSVFRRVINIEIPDEGLVSLVGPEIQNGPLYVSVEIPANIDLTTIGVERGHRVISEDKLVRVSDNVLEVSLETTVLWKPLKQFSDILDYSDIGANITALLRLVTSFGTHSDLYPLLNSYKLSEDNEVLTFEMNPVSRMALPHITKLLAAIKQNKSIDIVQSVMKLVGLGSGLTPAADDFLVGLMLSMHYMAESLNVGKIRVQDAINDIASCIHARTTKISEEFLQQAALGNGNEIVLSLLEALLTSNTIDLEHSAQKVMDFGGTSGIDTIIGILFGTTIMMSNEIETRNITDHTFNELKGTYHG